MSDYTVNVGTMECDYFFQLPPKRLLEYFLDVILTEMHRNGCGLDTLREQFDAVWMINHMRYTQSAPVCANDVLIFRPQPRLEGRSCYFINADVFRGGELLLRFECSFIPVYRVSRRIMRLSLLSPLWKTPPHPEAPATLYKLRLDCEFVPCGSDEVRLSDCDKNHHMTSGGYMSLACDALGYWESETPRLIREMQVDFSSEVYAGTTLRFVRGEANGLHYVRGIKPDGKIAFTAECDF